MFARIMPTCSMKLGRASDSTSVLDNVLESFANYQALGNNLLLPILSHLGTPICRVDFCLLGLKFYPLELFDSQKHQSQQDLLKQLQ
ncbi:MAG: hypothetical protein NTY40_05560 [Synechococcus sp. LacPavin_0920_WC12_MAG_50_7]|nr:hypothetical protein [Synechococcus sp. LacPavin_0920_WC12_MAG_50_7]